MKRNIPPGENIRYSSWLRQYGIDFILNQAVPCDFISEGGYVNLFFKYHPISVMHNNSATARHCARTSFMGVKTGTKLAENGHYGEILTKDYILDIFIAGLLHDVGKRMIYDDLLLKSPITDEEKAEIAMHADNGVLIASQIMPSSHRVLNFIRLHNKCNGSDRVLEKDGRGAPLGSYLLRVSDIFDALVTPRPYRDGVATPAEAMAEIMTETFPPFLAETFGCDVLADKRFMSRVYSGTDVEKHFMTAKRVANPGKISF